MCKKDITSTLGELIEHSGHVAKLLISGEIALNEGELKLTQKYTKEASETLSVMTKDIFVEVRESLCVSSKDTNDYDIPTTLELVKQLAEIVYNTGVMLGIVVKNTNESIQKTVELKLLKSINTVEEIYNAIYEN